MRRFAALLAALVLPLTAGCAGSSHRSEPTQAKRPTVREHLPSPRPARPVPVADHTVYWAQYGRDPARTGVAARSGVVPPFRVRWSLGIRSFFEFPPAIAGGRLFIGTDAGRIMAVDAATGAAAWMRDTGRCIAASPAFRNGLVYVGLMDPPPCGDQPASGRLVALRAATGKTVWQARAGVVESSPLVVGDTVYFGSWDGRLYALDAASGRLRWSFQAAGKVKGGAAYADGTVFFGTYDGRVYAVAAATGRQRWEANVGSSVYATPAVADGKVIVGTLDGAVYALQAADGRTAWVKRTGSYVYSSAATWRGTAYVGSYDGHLYALDLSSGAVRWAFDAGAAVSGTPTIVNGIVYISRCLGCVAGEPVDKPHRTFGLDARMGRLVWAFPDGEYTPMVADAKRAYLMGFTRLYGLDAVGKR